MIRAVSRFAVTAGTVAVLSATLSGCASSDSGFATRSTLTARHATQAPIVAWYRETGPRIAAVEQSITYAQWMVRRPGHPGLTAACSRIRTGVAAVRDAPVAPDANTRTELASEMQAFDRAADQCLSGDLDAAGRSVITGHRYAEVAGKRVVALLHAAS